MLTDITLEVEQIEDDIQHWVSYIYSIDNMIAQVVICRPSSSAYKTVLYAVDEGLRDHNVQQSVAID